MNIFFCQSCNMAHSTTHEHFKKYATDILIRTIFPTELAMFNMLQALHDAAKCSMEVSNEN